MLAHVHTFALDGLETRPVTVEVDIRQGLPAFVIVGLADAAVREARERVRAALSNNGFEFPLRRIVANLAPAHLRKGGSGFDLAIACGILAASGQVPVASLAHVALAGELSLTGAIRPSRGTLAVAQAAATAGLRGVIVARESAREAALVEGLEVCAASELSEVAELLRGGDAPPEPPPGEACATAAPDLDLSDVRGHAGAIEALRVAAAGGHNLLLSGPPGTGKTMLARRMPSILPPLSRQEAIEVTRIASVAGLHRGDGLVHIRPFRAPHHSVSSAGLVGGGSIPVVGEATLAHHGVLFLDELSEFSRPAIEALRQPLEDGRVAIVRGQRTAVFPTRFMLVAATNPCPCGFAGEPERCRCSEADLARYARRLSGPLLDRIDIVVDVQRPSAEALGATPVTDSATVRQAVLEARERQLVRLTGTRALCNSQMDAQLVRDTAKVDTQARDVLSAAYAAGGLSARGHERVVKVARTVADLAGSDRVCAQHVRQALALRPDRSMPAVVA